MVFVCVSNNRADAVDRLLIEQVPNQNLLWSPEGAGSREQTYLNNLTLALGLHLSRRLDTTLPTRLLVTGGSRGSKELGAGSREQGADLPQQLDCGSQAAPEPRLHQSVVIVTMIDTSDSILHNRLLPTRGTRRATDPCPDCSGYAN